ncbi:hypothetical protein ncot_13245 [Nocardioides sp. JQ2195]|uniref:hypothetical protein n=1 Tax=Nocardioides sp. JQ2195 TaxID=2592334 RepID=UPI00143E10DD|nr:hypothetical protein [Nocardioides sp. JQ2195]QIX27464.1 hypothetical protein ncot_13245 [Nocardioides sp. JQ2195]
MKVQIRRVSKTTRRHKADGKGSTLDKAFVQGFVDGYSVICRAGKGWDCSCLDDECEHPDAIADLLHPEMLAELEDVAE